jgi:flavin-dependent dehydrogenase
LGDQAGVIPSYTGDGMAIALHSGCLAASTYLGLAPSSSAFHTQLRNDISRQIRLASLFYEAGRRTAGQQAILQIFRAWPTAMRYVAALTRLRNDTVQRALIVS